ANHPLVKMVLGDKSPSDRAAELIKGTKLKDAAFRKKLYAGGKAAIDAARAAKKVFDAQEEIKKQAYGDIAKARFATEGTSTYPDATFTLRLSYGTVRGYEEDGKQIPAFTNFEGLYQRATEHENKPPFDLPQRWIDKKDAF